MVSMSGGSCSHSPPLLTEMGWAQIVWCWLIGQHALESRLSQPTMLGLLVYTVSLASWMLAIWIPGCTREALHFLSCLPGMLFVTCEKCFVWERLLCLSVYNSGCLSTCRTLPAIAGMQHHIQFKGFSYQFLISTPPSVYPLWNIFPVVCLFLEPSFCILMF